MNAAEQNAQWAEQHAHRLHALKHHPLGCPWPDRMFRSCSAYQLAAIEAGISPTPLPPVQQRTNLQRNPWSGVVFISLLLVLAVMLVVFR